MKKLSIPNRIIIFTLAIVCALAFIISGISVYVKKAASKKRISENSTLVLKIGDYEVDKDEFVFSCVQTIESQLSELSRSGIVENELNELVKEETTENIREYVAMLSAAKAAGVTLTESEKRLIELDANTIEDDKEFRENYNISREKYIIIKQNWKICEKYLENIKNTENISQEEIDKIYADNYTKLFTAEIKAIYFDTKTLAEGVSGLNKIEADNAFAALKEDKTLFQTLYEEYNDSGFSNDGLTTTVNEETYKNFPEVFDAVYTADVGNVIQVVTEKGIIVAEVIEKHTEVSAEKISEIYTENILQNIIESDITTEKTDAYNNIDISKYIDERRKLN